MEHTKKLLYQYEAMMKLKGEEAVRHQAWESELEVGCSAGEGQMAGSRVKCLTMSAPASQLKTC